MEIWYMVLHYNKLTDCKKKIEWGEMVQKDLHCVGESGPCYFLGVPRARW